MRNVLLYLLPLLIVCALALQIASAGFVVQHTAAGIVNTQTTSPNADTDGDGVTDGSDNCFSRPNPGQGNVIHPASAYGDHCDDPEPDGVPDISDNCPDAINPLQENAVHSATATGDHCEDPESDGVSITTTTVWTP